ncbi:MAG: glucoamylase family protein [Alistipes sp.]|nr:glucoamylase family protein [Alistipes sp.]
MRAISIWIGDVLRCCGRIGVLFAGVCGIGSTAIAAPSATPDLRTLFGREQGAVATGYDAHVELQWPKVEQAVRYTLLRMQDGKTETVGQTENLYYLDFVPARGVYTYRIEALDSAGRSVWQSPPLEAKVSEMTDVQLQQMVQRYTLRYFWEFADPQTGLIYERSNDTRVQCVTIGGTGFGMMGLVAAVENGWLSRQEVVARLHRMTQTLEQLPRFHGAWAHWYNAGTFEPYHFSEKDNGGDLVETAFLVEGLLAVAGYFDGADSMELALRERIDRLWRTVEWSHYTQGQAMLYWHWSPDYGFAMNHPIRGYDETFITYILAASSPTYPISRAVYEQGWVNFKEGEFFCATDFYNVMLPLGKRLQMGGPLFWVHYSYLGLDPRGLSDRYADYGEQNRRYTLINRAYCIDNPYRWVGYGADFWGLTASDALPEGYRAHAPGVGNDFGTIAPTAALSSMPYTPQESMAVLRNLYRNYGAVTFGIMGFYDAVNLSLGAPCSTKSYIAIDQGPILVMLENHLHETLWKAFMRNRDVRRGLSLLGFQIHHQPIAPED